MPSFISPPTSIRVSADQLTLLLSVRHQLNAGKLSEKIHRAKKVIPKEINVDRITLGFFVSLVDRARPSSDNSFIADQATNYIRTVSSRI